MSRSNPGLPDDDDLLEPSLQDRGRPYQPQPWRVGSQFWVAFFGGVLAIGSIAYLNGKRLGISRERQRWIVIATILAFILSLVVAGYFVAYPVRMELRIVVRRIVQVVSVVLYLVLAWIQKPADRRHQLFDGKYASLWKPGFLALGASLVLTLGGLLIVVVAVTVFRS